jgi:hypothetical protein
MRLLPLTLFHYGYKEDDAIMIKILNADFERLGVIKNAISSNRFEEINGENIVEFNAVLDQKLNDFIDENSIFEVDDDWFDAAYLKKTLNENNTFVINVESEHVSYRLNREEYNVEFFTEMGTPTYILGKILEGTGFTVGTVEFNITCTYSAQEAKSRRQLLMEFAAYLKGEIIFNKFEVSIVERRGSSVAKPAIKDRNVKVVSKIVNKRQLDENGNPTLSYSCVPIYLSGDYAMGDNVVLVQKELDIREELRVVSISRDIYDPKNVVFQFANYTNGLENSLYRIATSAVVKDAVYNGARIGPEYGFESVRNDKKARAYFRSDEMKFQSGDGTGENWKDRLYYDYDSEKDETVLMFNGKLSAEVINALTAVITPNLYAEKATIAELTVDSLDTSVKVQNYLKNDESDVNYIKIRGQVIQFIMASVLSNYKALRTSSDFWDMAADPQIDIYYAGVSISDTGEINFTNGANTNAWAAFMSGRVYRALNSTSYYKLTGTSSLSYVHYDIYDVSETSAKYEQAKNRNGELLYWVDDTHEAASTDVTDLPVYIYLYNESVKMEYSFNHNGTHYIPRITMGAGSGVGDNDKLFIEKGVGYADIKYISETGKDVPITLTEFVDAKMRRIKTVDINKSTGEIEVLMEGLVSPDRINFSETANSMTFEWPDGYTATVSIS